MPMWINNNYRPPQDPAFLAKIDHIRQKNMLIDEKIKEAAFMFRI